MWMGPAHGADRQAPPRPAMAGSNSGLVRVITRTLEIARSAGSARQAGEQAGEEKAIRPTAITPEQDDIHAALDLAGLDHRPDAVAGPEQDLDAECRRSRRTPGPAGDRVRIIGRVAGRRSQGTAAGAELVDPGDHRRAVLTP